MQEDCPESVTQPEIFFFCNHFFFTKLFMVEIKTAIVILMFVNLLGVNLKLIVNHPWGQVIFLQGGGYMVQIN